MDKNGIETCIKRKFIMSIHVNLNTPHHVVAANAHYYKTPTEERYIDRTLPNHDLIYLAEGSWSITENEQDYPLQKDDVLLLSAGRVLLSAIDLLCSELLPLPLTTLHLL